MLSTDTFLSEDIFIAVPTEIPVFLICFLKTGLIRQSLPPGERTVSHKNYLLRRNSMRQNFKSQVFIYGLYRRGNKVM